MCALDTSTCHFEWSGSVSAARAEEGLPVSLYLKQQKRRSVRVQQSGVGAQWKVVFT